MVTTCANAGVAIVTRKAKPVHTWVVFAWIYHDVTDFASIIFVTGTHETISVTTTRAMDTGIRMTVVNANIAAFSGKANVTQARFCYSSRNAGAVFADDISTKF